MVAARRCHDRARAAWLQHPAPRRLELRHELHRVGRPEQRLGGRPIDGPADPLRRRDQHLRPVARLGITGHEHAGLLRRHGLEDHDRRQHPERLVDDRLAPRERAVSERRGPDFLQAVVDVVERLHVEDGEVQPRAVEILEVLDVRVAAHEAADGVALVGSGEEPDAVELAADALAQLGRERRLLDRILNHVQPGSDPRRQLALALARGDELAKEGLVGALDEVRQRLAGGRDAGAAHVLGHGDLRVLIVVVVGPEGDHDAAGDMVGEEVLQLTEEGGLGPADLPRVAPPHLHQIPRRFGRDVELVTIDVQLRRRVYSS